MYSTLVKPDENLVEPPNIQKTLNPKSASLSKGPRGRPGPRASARHTEAQTSEQTLYLQSPL